MCTSAGNGTLKILSPTCTTRIAYLMRAWVNWNGETFISNVLTNEWTFTKLDIDLASLHSFIQFTLPVEITIFDCFIALIRTIIVPVASRYSFDTLTITAGKVTATG